MSDTTKTTLHGARTEVLNDEDDEPDRLLVHGAALGNDDITHGMMGLKKLWPAEELEKAYETLEGRNFMKNHEVHQVESVIGSVTKAEYDEDLGIIYEAEINGDNETEREIYKKIQRDQLEVSVTVQHDPIDEAEEDEETGALIMTGLNFIELSAVPVGASETADVHPGEHPQLAAMSKSELAERFDMDAASGTIETRQTSSLTNNTDDSDKTDETPDDTLMTEDNIEELKAWFQEEFDASEALFESTEEMERLAELKQLDEEMAEYDDPAVIERNELEQLEDRAEEADAVSELFAEKLSDDDSIPFTEEELLDKFTVDELKDKFDDVFGIDSLTEPSAPNPKSDSGGTEDQQDPEQVQQLKQEIEDLKEKRDFYESQGWDSHKEDVEDELAAKRAQLN